MHSSSLTDLLVILLASILTNNILFSKFLGMCSFIALSKSMKTSFGMGAAVTVVTLCTAVINYWIYYGVLVANTSIFGVDLTYLSFLVFIMVIAGFVQLVEMVLERFSPVLYLNMGIYLPLITVNCVILGVMLTMIDPNLKFGVKETAMYSLGSGAGYWLAICLMAAIRQRLSHADIPKPLAGLGIALIITGIMAMAFMGFSGIVNL